MNKKLDTTYLYEWVKRKKKKELLNEWIRSSKKSPHKVTQARSLKQARFWLFKPRVH